MISISGNTYPVKDKLKALGGRWNPETKTWAVPDERVDEARAIVAGTSGDATPSQAPRAVEFRHTSCKVCGFKPTSRYEKIYRSGECRDCYEERKMGY